MTIRLKFPIRYKILVVLSAVVMAAVALYLYLASRLFYEDKTVLVYELNQTNVRTLAADLRVDLDRVIDKLKLVAATQSSPEIFAAVFGGEDDLVGVGVLERNAQGEVAKIFSHVWPKYLEVYRKNSAYLDEVRRARPIPFDRVVKNGIWVRNSTLGPPLMTVAMALSDSNPRRVIYADVRLDRLLESFASSGIARAYAVDSEGRVLAHPEQEAVAADVSLANDPLVQTSVASKLRSEVKKFDEGDRSYLGSYFQTGVAGVIVASKVETGEAFAAARRLIRKSLIYASVVVTAAFLIALLFSHSLTTPIQKMLEATHQIAKGDFTTSVKVSTNDELAMLASSFNKMTSDLKMSREQIEEYSRDLEKKVQDRTARLEAQNIAIKEAQEALVRTTRLASVGEIAGRAAHEVLNPLTNVTARLEKIQSSNVKPDLDDLRLLTTIVQAWIDGLKNKGREGLIKDLLAPSATIAGGTMLDEDLENLRAIAVDLVRRLGDRKHDVDFLLKEAGRINKIVNGMRQLTRVSGNRGPIEIHALLNETLATMNDVLAKRKIVTETRYCAQSPVVLADHDELLQVFSNLVRNSMQALEEGVREKKPVGQPPKVWFTTEVVGSRVRIRVCDNGPGISPEDISKVFEASFTTKSVTEGTGLGLSISRRFIRAFDGEIIVERSVPGDETAFLIELPEMKPNA